MRSLSIGREESQEAGKDIWGVLVGSLVIALAAQVSVPLPFSPVPFTLQTVAILSVGLVLGPWRGFFAVAAYLLEGAMGMPVFALGQSGIAVLFGPRAGYLMAFLLASFLAGTLSSSGAFRSRWWVALSFLGIYATILACGGLWLAAWLGFSQAWAVGVVPFLLTESIKVPLLMGLLPFLSRLKQNI